MRWFGGIRKLSPVEGYNLWAPTYHAEANPVKKMSDDFVSEMLPGLSGKSVLDAGCGTGKFCSIAVEQRASFVKGIDLSPGMVGEAKKNSPTATFECSSLSAAIIETQHYDVIICALVLAHIEDHKPVLVNLIKGLKAGGTIIITDFHPYQSKMKAKRTFKDAGSGKIFEITHTGHAIDDYLSAFKNNDVTQTAFSEPRYNGNPVIFGFAGVKS